MVGLIRPFAVAAVVVALGAATSGQSSTALDKPKGLSPQTSEVATSQSSARPTNSQSGDKPLGLSSSRMTPADQSALVGKYCATCHNDRTKAGEISMAEFASWKTSEKGETIEK